MIEPLALLRLLTWLSPAFPTGAFAYSHGLEWAVEAGDVRDADGLREWLHCVLAHGGGRSDTILLRHTHRAWDDAETLATVSAFAVANAPSRERRGETLAQGMAFGLAGDVWTSAMVGEGRSSTPSGAAEGAVDGRPPPTMAGKKMPYPVAVGALAGAHGIAEDDVALAYLHAFTSNLISAGVRLVPLGQSAGVAVLAALQPTLLAVAAETRDASLDDIGGCAFRVDLASMRHETQYTRLFRS